MPIYSKRDRERRVKQRAKNGRIAKRAYDPRPYFFPVAALELADTLVKLDLVLLLLETVDVDDIGECKTVEQRQFNRNMLRSTRALIRTWKRYGNNKMKFQYLANT